MPGTISRKCFLDDRIAVLPARRQASISFFDGLASGVDSGSGIAGTIPFVLRLHLWSPTGKPTPQSGFNPKSPPFLQLTRLFPARVSGIGQDMTSGKRSLSDGSLD